ncbi:MAG: sugar diacid recognition domain-containing protein [Tissierellaceae bacterium]
MNVSKDLAQDIVENMKEIISQEINYFDNRGFIIASTDKTRVGDFHGGAKKVLNLKRDVIVNFDGQYKGARQGINIPVYFESEVVGVIGITGEKEEVEKYGKIIQRMTEILIKEGYIKEQEKIERESKRQFIEELLFRYHSDDKSLLTRAELLNIKIDTNRVVVIARIVVSENSFVLTPEINEEIFNSFRNYVEYRPQNLIAQSGMNIIMICELWAKENIETLILEMKRYIEDRYGVKVYFGIGQDYDNISKIKKSYREAKKALDIAIALKNREILHYNDLDIGLLIDDISMETINKYTKRVFKDMTREEINEYLIIIDSYIKHNGSIKRTSQELFIHKNTLQYRLKRLKKITGFDPRNINDMVVLYFAFVLFRLEFSE